MRGEGSLFPFCRRSSVPLPPGFEYGYGHRVRQVQTACLRANRNSQQPLAVLLQETRRQPARLAAEDEHVARFISNRGVALLGRFRKAIGPARRQTIEKLSPVVDRFPFEMLPIVEARAAQVIVVEAKAQRPDQP